MNRESNGMTDRLDPLFADFCVLSQICQIQFGKLMVSGKKQISSGEFAVKILSKRLRQGQVESAKPGSVIAVNLKELGNGG